MRTIQIPLNAATRVSSIAVARALLDVGVSAACNEDDGIAHADVCSDNETMQMFQPQ